MNHKLPTLEQAMNANERFLRAISLRLDIIIEQNNSIIDHLSRKDNVATTEHTSVDQILKPEYLSKEKLLKKEEPQEEVKKPIRRKRVVKDKE